MSLLGKIVGGIERAYPGGTAMLGTAIGASYGMPQVGGGIGGALGSKYGPTSGMPSMPGGGFQNIALPALPALVGGAVAMGRIGMAGAAAATRGAIALCRKHPAWCSSIGGTAAVAGMISAGQIPAPRRGRRRGITASEFRGFKRVHKVLSGFCAPRMKIRRKGAACR